MPGQHTWVSRSLTAISSQKTVRAGMVQERNAAAATLAALKTEHAQAVAHSRQVEAEAAPVVYVAEMLGIGADPERAIRWLIMMMVLCCDPMAIALTAATAARC